MDDIKSIEIRELKVDHIPHLVQRLLEESTEYLQHFTPFDFSEQEFQIILTSAINDKYFGIFCDDELIGFYMLRGFDEGYEIPSYGVVILSKFSNLGISKLTLYHAFSLCKINKIKRLMLKVHPENKYAKKLYESMGFEKTGFDKQNGNFIYHKSLSS